MVRVPTQFARARIASCWCLVRAAKRGTNYVTRVHIAVVGDSQVRRKMTVEDEQVKVPSAMGMFHRSSSLSTAMFPFDGDDDSRSGVRLILSRLLLVEADLHSNACTHFFFYLLS